MPNCSVICVQGPAGVRGPPSTIDGTGVTGVQIAVSPDGLVTLTFDLGPLPPVSLLHTFAGASLELERLSVTGNNVSSFMNVVSPLGEVLFNVSPTGQTSVRRQLVIGGDTLGLQEDSAQIFNLVILGNFCVASATIQTGTLQSLLFSTLRPTMQNQFFASGGELYGEYRTSVFFPPYVHIASAGSISATSRNIGAYLTYFGPNNTVTPRTLGYNLSGVTQRFRDLYLANQPNVSSDARTKDEVEDEPQSLEFVKLLAPKQYRLIKEDTGQMHQGFLLQDLQALLPGLAGRPDAIAASSGVCYEQILAPVVAALQVLAARACDLRRKQEMLALRTP